MNLFAYGKIAIDLPGLRQCFGNTFINRTNNIIYQNFYPQNQHYI